MASTNMFRHVQQTTAQSDLFERRLALAFVLALSLFSMCFLLHPQSANAHTTVTGSCGSNHCYGTTFWPGHTLAGAANIVARGLNGGDGFTLNDLWVIDTNPNQVEDCRVFDTSKRGYCWIEAGYKAFGTNTPYAGTERFVWADVRPGYRYAEHVLGQLSNAPNGAGDYGHNIWFAITQLTPTTTWAIILDGNATKYPNEQSTSNSMYADQIKIGIELSGSQGWSAPHAHYTDNQFSIGGNTVRYQTQNGTISPNPPTYPAYGKWTTLPSNSSTGGDWYTCVQTAGC